MRIIPLLLLIAVCFYGQTAAASSPETRLVIPDGRAYAGAYIDFGEREDTVTLEQIEGFDQQVGRRQAIVAFSSDWGNQSFPQQQLAIITHYGAIPLVFWSPWDRPVDHNTPRSQRGRFNLQAILAGQWDEYIDQWASQAKEYGKPLFVSWGLEMNGDWFSWSGVYYGKDAPVDGCAHCFAGPEIFKKTYRYVVDRVRAKGASNILWVWHPNNGSVPEQPWNAMSQYYPGPDYADWLALSAYGKQFKGPGWISVDAALSRAYQELSQVDPAKPLMLAEWGIGEFPKEGSKAQWIAEFFQRLPGEFPKFRAIVFWHERWQNEDLSVSNLRVNSSAEALDAYRKGIADRYWLDRPIWQSVTEEVKAVAK
ncbi:MAG: beta-mannanase [Synechococcaceae cyanobacterium SM1_2_3]|nr:beta-mannanase [Synechococcaceae cyanobacterium SM1_2_3]